MVNDIEKKLESFFEPAKSGNPTRAMLAFLRAKYHFFTHAFTLVDRKANIMVRLHSVIISAMVLFTKLSDLSAIEMGILGVLLIASLISLTFSILAARPIESWSLFDVNRSGRATNHLFDFKRLGNLTFEEYCSGFDEVMKDEKLIFGNMARDLFQITKAIAYKYSLLRWSYRSYLIGLTLVVILLLTSWVVAHGM